MKYIILILVLFLAGCTEECQVRNDPMLGNSFIIVPAGSNICGLRIREDGLYMEKGLFMSMFVECNKADLQAYGN